MIKLLRFNGRVKQLLAAALTASMLFSGNVVSAFAEEPVESAEMETEAVDSVEYEEVFEESVEEAADEVVYQNEETLEEEYVEEAVAEEIEAAEELVDTVSGDNTPEPGNTPSGNSISANEIAGNTNELPAPGKLTAALTKTNVVKLTWAGVKKATGYAVYRMKADGTADMTNPIYEGKKKSFTDTLSESSSVETLAYKVMAIGTDPVGKYGYGYPSYAVAAPIITEVERTKDDPDEVAFDVKLTTIKGAKDYTLYRDLKKSSKNYIERVSHIGNTDGKECEAYAAGGAIKSKTGTPIFQEKIKDDNAISTSVYYYYKAKAYYQIAGGDLIESGYSTAARGRITTRAPELRVVESLSGTKIHLEWEDLENATDKDGNKIISSSDYYQLYVSINGKKWKKGPTLKAGKLDQVTHPSTEKKFFTAAEAIEQGIGTTEGYYDVDTSTVNVAYDMEELTPQKDYSFKVCAVRNKIEGNFSNISTCTTELRDIDDLKVKGTNLTSATLTWKEVEGATGYNVYYTDEITSAQAADKENLSKLDYHCISTKPVYLEAKDKEDDMNTDEICTYTKTGLTNLKYYAFYVEPVYKKTEHVSAKRMYVAAQTRIAAPDVKITQSGSTLKLTWEKVSKATGYRVEYLVGSTNTEELSTSSVVTRNVLSGSAASTSITVDEIGKPVAVKITTLYAKNGLTNNDPDAQGNAYEKVEYRCPGTPEVSDALYNTENTGADLRLSYTTTGVNTTKYKRGYQIWTSSKKTKEYVLEKEFTDSTIQYIDNKYLKNGTKRYYRVYAVTQNVEHPDWLAKSREYKQIVFCNPTSVTAQTISVDVDSSKEYTLNFKPSGTTMKQVSSWYVSDTASPKTESFNEQVTKNKYISISTTDYDSNNDGFLSPKIKIKGLKKGTTYIEATTANGLTAVITVKVKENEDDKDDDKDDDDKPKGITICLDPGHGGSDGGASSGNLKESELTLKVSKYTKDYLEKAGFKVVLTRDSNKAVDLEERVKIAKRNKATAIIAQHFNSGSGKGVECYYSVDGTGKSLASKLCTKTSDETGMKNRGAKTRESESTKGKDYYAIIRYARSSSDGGAITGIIMENGFIQNDADYMNTDEKLKKIAKANADAIISYYK